MKGVVMRGETRNRTGDGLQIAYMRHCSVHIHTNEYNFASLYVYLVECLVETFAQYGMLSLF